MAISGHLAIIINRVCHFAIGAGLARLGADVEVNDDDWIGKVTVTDSYHGYRVFGTLYF
jgi:hypothetical protein